MVWSDQKIDMFHVLGNVCAAPSTKHAPDDFVVEHTDPDTEVKTKWYHSQRMSHPQIKNIALPRLKQSEAGGGSYSPSCRVQYHRVCVHSMLGHMCLAMQSNAIIHTQFSHFVFPCTRARSIQIVFMLE